MSNLKHVLVCLWLLLFALSASAQEYPVIHFTTNDGLPSNTIYKVYRDSKGFLWITTDKGLSRYNGLKFETFSTEDGLPDNEIFFCQEDHFGRIWLATYNGELCYYKEGVFHNAANTPWLKLPFKTSFINNITIEKDSTITIMFYEKHNALNIQKNRLRHVYLDNDTTHDNLINISKINSNAYKFLYADKVVQVDTLHRLIKTYKHNYSYYKGRFCPGWDKAIAQDQRYFFNDRVIYNQEMKIMKAYEMDWKEGLHINCIYFNGQKEYFVGTDKGLIINDVKHILRNSKVTSVTQDIAQNYWIGTLKDGLYLLDFQYENSNFWPNTYMGNITYTYSDARNTFFVNSNNGLYQLKNDQVVTLYKPKDDAEWPDENVSNLGHLVYQLGPEQPYFYVNYNKNYSLIIKDLLDKKQVIKNKTPLNEASYIKSILNIHSRLYIRSIQKIFSLDLNKALTQQGQDYSLLKVFNNEERIFGFAKSYEQEIWYSTVNGVYKLKNDSEVLQNQFAQHGISFKRFEFLPGLLIGYTYSNKLLVISNYNGQLQIDTIKNQNCIWDKFYKLDNNHLLLSTSNLYRVFTKNPIGFKDRYTISAVEQLFAPLQAEAITCDSQHCYFFKNSSITRIAKKNVIHRALPPIVYYTFIRYGGGQHPIRSQLLLPYNSSKNISISFAALSFYAKDITYQYAIDKGRQEVWQDLKGEEINLINPGYGDYKVKIRAKTTSSDYCEPISFSFTILKPFWAKWWFIGLVTIIASTLVLLVIRYRIILELRKREKEHEQKIRFMRSEYKALNALMNPHFIFNTLNNVQGLVNRNDKIAANEYLRIFADLVRQNMHNVSKELIPLQKELDLITNYLALEKLRFKELLNYDLMVDDEVETSLIMVPPLIIQPLIENSIKHGILPRQSVDSKIIVKVFEVDDILYIQVKDNGIGFNNAGKKKDPNHESYGLGNIKSRLQQLSVILGKKIDFYFSEELEGEVSWTVATIEIAI